MSRELFKISFAVCAVVGAITLYSLVTLLIANALIRRIKARRPRIVPIPRSGHGPAGSSDLMRRRQDVDRAWETAVVLLGAPVIANRAQPFIDVVDRAVDWDGLCLEAEAWTKADRLLVRVACELCRQGSFTSRCPAPSVSISELVGDIDQPRTDLICAALNLRRGRCSLEQALKLSARIRKPPGPSRGRVLSRRTGGHAAASGGT